MTKEQPLHLQAEQEGQAIVAPTGLERFQASASKAWFRFSRNKLSVVGLAMVLSVVLAAVFAKQIVPYPDHIGAFVDFANASQAPSAAHWFGTDTAGRDIFSRVIFAYREALLMAVLVLAIAVPAGVIIGLFAGYRKGTWVDTVVMRVTDIFLGLPSLILAFSIAAVLKPTLTNCMIAVTLTWWPWYARMVYGIASSARNEYYVVGAGLIGAKRSHILFREILPNCFSPVLTKMALDVGVVVLISASLAYLGLGTQPPAPSLGQMISSSSDYMTKLWWMTVYPALSIVYLILGFNFLGDGVRDMLAKGDLKYA